jgi:D-amino peptidase
MEGTCGVSSWVQVTPPEYGDGPSSTSEYERARARMTKEVNAAVEGALAGGADEVIVNDSHNGMRNLVADDLHPSVRFITGNDKPFGMMQGIDLEGIGAVIYTGYHAKAGTPNAPLAHTWTGWLNDVRFNGLSTGEFGINAAVAGFFNVPVVMVAGDIRAVEQTRAFVGEDCVGVVVKEGLSTFAAVHLHPLKAQQLIREGAERAIAAVSKVKPYKLPESAAIEVEFEHQTRADQAAYIPGVERGGERFVVFHPKNGLDFIHTFRAIVKAGQVRMAP